MWKSIQRAAWKACAAAAILGLVGVMTAWASGQLDTTFDGDGKQTGDTVSWHDVAYGLTLQPDGKIVAVGTNFNPSDPYANSRDIEMRRFDPGGSPTATLSLYIFDTGAAETGAAVKVDSNNNFLFAARTCPSGVMCDLDVARATSTLGCDSTFNSCNDLKVDFGGGDNGTYGGLAIRPSDKKIVVAGYMQNGSNYDFAVYRIRNNGTLDTSFSGDGKQKIGFGSGRGDVAFDLALAGSKTVVVGETCKPYPKCDFAVARLTDKGKLDLTFNGTGKVVTDFGGQDHAYGVAIQPDGKIVVVGTKSTVLKTVMAVARYNIDGSLDTTFSTDGMQTVSVGATGVANDVLVQGNGKIVISGEGFNGTNGDFAIVRLKANGALDKTFSGDGKTLVDFGGNDVAHALARQPADGRYVLAGSTDVSGNYDFALARIMP